MENMVLQILDGTVYVVLRMEDMLDIVEEYAGDEERDYIADYIRDLEEESENAAEEAAEYRKDIEELQEEHRALVLDIRDEAEASMDLLSAQRLDRRRLTEVCASILKIADSVL